MPESKRRMGRPEMPLDYYFGLIDQANGQFLEEMAAGDSDWEVKQEEFVAECMKQQGFKYQPWGVEPQGDGPSDILGGVPTTVDVPWLPEDRTEVERYGYGYYFPPEQPDHGPLSQVDPEGDAELDPNADYVASLSESARHEYEVALYGADWAAYDLSGFESVPAPEMGGCTGQAWEKYPSPVVVAFDESPVQSTYSDLVDQIRVQDAPDPYSWALEEQPVGPSFLKASQVEVLDDEWAKCFEVEFGRPLPTPDPLLVGDGGTVSPITTPDAAWSLALETGPDGEYWHGTGDVLPVEYDSLTGTENEIKIALADFDCRQKTDYVERFFEIMRDSQNQFIAEHKSELDDMAAAIEQYVAE
jgi:hypothetical protein